jgi:hypothetical protein
MKELVEVIAKALVDNPEEVVVTEKGEGKNITIELHVAADGQGDRKAGQNCQSDPLCCESGFHKGQ